MSEITAEEIAANYAAMLIVANRINKIVAGTKMADSTEEERQESIDTCVAHLQLMVNQDYWMSEDMAPINAAIAAGEAA
jgi:hypothetical protein|tara:strand:+ start:229 stop:465 length:237 start_codon:yes stop_codon:yes gene_type:complete